MNYILTSPMIEGGGIIFNFTNSKLVGFEIQAQLSDEQHDWFMRHLPTHEDDLHQLTKKMQKGKIKQIEPDLSFDNFWKLYAHKVGNKKKAEKLWNNLSKANKAKALNWLPSYKNQVKGSGVARLYPETFINQQRWNN